MRATVKWSVIRRAITRAREVLLQVFQIPVLEDAMLGNHQYKKLCLAGKLPIGQFPEEYQM